MRIFAKKLDGWTKELTVCETDTLDRVRERVISVLPDSSVSVGRVQLVYQGNVIEHGRLCDVGVQEESVLIVVIQERQFVDITIESSDGRFVLKGVESCETVSNVKVLISQRKGYSVDEQQLVFGGRQIVEGRLHHAGIVQGSVIRLTLRAIEICVKDFQGKSHTFQVRTSDKVSHLMGLVQDRLRVNSSQQVLTHEGKQLQSERQLQEYSIRENSVVYLTGRLRGG